MMKSSTKEKDQDPARPVYQTCNLLMDSVVDPTKHGFQVPSNLSCHLSCHLTSPVHFTDEVHFIALEFNFLTSQTGVTQKAVMRAGTAAH